MTAQEFIDAFEELFKKEKLRINSEWAKYCQTGKKPQAYSLDFGIASALLNRDLRSRCIQPTREQAATESIEQKAERVRLKWAYAYWWNRLHLLELLAKTQLGEAKTRKNVEKGGMTLRKLVSGTISVDKIHPQFLKLIDSLNAIKIQEAVGSKVSDLLLK